MTQVEAARQGKITDEMRVVAEREKRPVAFISEGLKNGTIVIPVNRLRRGRYALGIGAGLATKVNANIGSSSDEISLETELEKLRAAIDAGADTVMDLSTGGDIDAIRDGVLEASTVPVGSVPIYGAAITAVRSKRAMVEMTEDEIFGSIERHLKSGIDFVTVHCGVTRSAIERLKQCGRLTDVLSRGGSFML